MCVVFYMLVVCVGKCFGVCFVLVFDGMVEVYEVVDVWVEFDVVEFDFFD